MHLGESLTQAESRFKSLERRLDRNPDLRKRYSDFINEFISLGHMEVIPQEEINKPSNEVYYLPHHCVFKEDSTTTKLRVVFDGSSKTSNGVSLNESLMIGPVVQNYLFTILNRFRFKVVALSADIAKMYRQVELDSPDKDFHRLLWRNSKNEEIQHLRMMRVTYGIASSAFHSTRCLKEVASQTQFESVTNALNNCFYVDDFLGGADSIEDARNLVKELCLELSKFGFELRKRTSSHPELTMELPLELRQTSDQLQLFSEEYKIKTLGICWKPISDTFIFSVDLDDISQTTKRTLLSDSSKVFDPIDTVISWSISSGSSSRMWFVFSGKNGRTIRPKRKVATRLYCQIFKLHFLFRCLLNLFRRKIRLNSREEFRQYCLKLRFNRKLYVSTIRNFVSF